MRSLGWFFVVVQLESVCDKRGAIFTTHLNIPATFLLKLLMEGDVYHCDNDQTANGDLFTDRL